MTLNHLRIFIAVAESGSMSEAARSCHLAQPTVSQSVRELEEYYSALLFERLSRRLYITEEGKKLLLHAKKVAAAYDELENEMSSGRLRERLRVGSSVTIGMCVMPEIIERFEKLRPQCDIYSFVNNTETIESKLLSSELDVAVVEGRIRNHELLCSHLSDDFVVLFCSSKHPLANSRLITLDELSSCKFVLREKGSGTREIFENYMIDNGMKIDVKWEVACFDSTMRAVLEEGCIGVASVRLAAFHPRSAEIRLISAAGGELDRTFSIVYHKNKYITDPLRLFLETAGSVTSVRLPDKRKMITLEARGVKS